MKAVSLQRVNSFLLCGVLTVVVLHYARQVMIPVAASALLAMLVTPLACWFEGKGIKRVYSTIFCVLIILLVLTFIVFLVVVQGKKMSDDIPKIQEKTGRLISQVQSYVQHKWKIDPEQQLSIAKEQSQTFLQSAGTGLKNILAGLSGAVGGIVLTTVFAFLLLYQREKYEIFFLKVYKGEDPEHARNIFRKIAIVAQFYLVGRLLSIGFLTILYTTGLLIAGVNNAFLLSFIAALLTIVPYVGTVIGGLFPVLMTLVTEDSFGPAAWTLGIVVFVQAIDNYFIEPYVVGGEVNISAFFTILAVAAGGFIWGIAGMIMFIPLFGIAKIIFDHVTALEPYGFLVGDQEEGRQSTRLLKKIRKLFGA